MKFKLFFAIILLCAASKVQAQEKSNLKYGRVSPEDFAPKLYSIDSNANAVVIGDIGSCQIVGNSKSSFSLEFKRYRRIRILNKNGYEEANVYIRLYKDGAFEDKLGDIKAVTYNMENGKVVETKLDKKEIFEDKINKKWTVKKFTFPNIKEGSIIEYEYTMQSDHIFNLHPWEFQGSIPELWSEYNLKLPEFLGYVFLTQGYQKYYINDRKDNRANFTVRDTRGTESSSNESFDANVTDYHWVMKDVPALKEEGYVSTIDNDIDKIEFQMSDIRYPLTPRNVMGTWPKLTNDLLNEDDFGSTLDKNNGWLSDVDGPLTAGIKDDLGKAKKIYAYVRDNFTCTSHNSTALSQTLKNVLRTKNGSVADINLLLVAMFKYANIPADPVILSTRSNGYAFALYPILDRFNYVVCDANINGQRFYLDASEPRLGFGRLPYQCYNGSARVINADATALEFSADSLLEKKFTSILLNTDEKGNIIGTLQQIPGYFESHEIRDKIKAKGKDEFFKEVKKAYGQDVTIMEPNIDSLDNLEENVAIKYDFKLNDGKEDLLYINPMFGEGYKENPFKSAERFYPVEMPYAMDETYIFNMFIPEGYDVDELPKSIVVKLNEEGDGQFEYRVSEAGGTISMRSRVQLKRAFYQPEEYEMLREFFNMIVKKHNEQIVLKKKK